MVKQLIEAYPKVKRIARSDGSKILNIAEHFYDTIQGENLVGVPSAFMRLKSCTLNCVWCDTAEVWRKGNPYSTEEIIELWEEHGLVDRFKNEQHLVLTGGSPLLQQDGLVDLLQRFEKKYSFIPIVEIENECTLMPTDELISYVHIWNNSPKLENSKMHKRLRYKPDVLCRLRKLQNSYFKFVVTSKEDWNEIVMDYLVPGHINKRQVVLMPEGQTREELQRNYDFVVDLCCVEGLRMTDRLHVTMWNKKTGV